MGALGSEGAAVLCMMTHLPVDTVVWNARALLLVGTEALQGVIIMMQKRRLDRR